MVLEGELLWDADKKSESFPVFLRSAQLNPSNWLPFLYLGRYYNSWADHRDAEKARKCFLKSFSLNPRSREAGMALSDIFREQVATFSTKALLHQVSSVLMEERTLKNVNNCLNANIYFYL